MESQRVIKSELVLVKNVHTLCTNSCLYNRLFLLHFVCFSQKKAITIAVPHLYLVSVHGDGPSLPPSVREGKAQWLQSDVMEGS